MNGLRIVVVGGFLAYQGLFQWFSRRLILPTLVLRPMMQLAVFTVIGAYLGSQPADFYAVGNAVQTTARASVYAATIVIAAERMNGTLITVLAAPAHPLLVFGGRLLPPVLTGVASAALMMTVAMATTGVRLSWSATPSLLLLILLVSASCGAFGLVLGAIGLYLRDVFFLPNVAVYAMMLLCGVNLTPAETSGVLALLGEALPLTHGLRAIRDVIAGRPVTTAAWTTELLLVFAYGAAACVFLAYFARQARSKATLDLSS
ncbi:ABC transporter permease [Micromonospora sagamiensis]|uniref:ABC-2 type transport system permease protein n=1 Tax=Micromonospora sagamiensis TaxID=47875 RepID=A0A562WK74_9ACTN|nr:ABC transporter permease [Micromonospora sagamiensis]TWJ30297.1 ABC-2 type transport system permease protein [Micromonospora sagamiensis]BCL16673.1 hypothetical protein GCM10017556_44120 [Micromonospora sagamiensis]